MPILGLKQNIKLTISVPTPSEDELDQIDDFSSFERSDTFNSTTSDDLCVNTIFNAVADGMLAVQTPPLCTLHNDPAKAVPIGSLEVGQKVLCRDGSRDTWQKAVVRSLHPIKLTAEGANIRRPFKDVKPFPHASKPTALSSEAEFDFDGPSPTSENTRIRPERYTRVRRSVSVGGGILKSPRNVKFSLVQYSDTEEVEDLVAGPPPPPLSPAPQESPLISELKKDDSFFDEIFE